VPFSSLPADVDAAAAFAGKGRGGSIAVRSDAIPSFYISGGGINISHYDHGRGGYSFVIYLQTLSSKGTKSCILA